MKYFFDTNVFIALSNFYNDVFPTFWKKFNGMVEEGKIFSTRENYDEYKKKDFIKKWMDDNIKIFEEPTFEESEFIAQKIFTARNFIENINQKQRRTEKQVADPFIIAKAKVNQGMVVTMEKPQENSSKIPNICEYFGIPCKNLEGFIKQQNWQF